MGCRNSLQLRVTGELGGGEFGGGGDTFIGEDGEGEERYGMDLRPHDMFRECQGEYIDIICKYG